MATLTRLLQFDGSLAPEKCHLGFQEVSLLGYVIFEGGLKADEAKVE